MKISAFGSRLRYGILAFVVCFLFCVPGLPLSSFANKESRFLRQRPAVDFEKVRKRYAEELLRPFVDDLVRREQFLISLIRQIEAELTSRDIYEWPRTEAGFRLVNARGDSLAREYRRELRRLLGVFSALEGLEREARAGDRSDLVWSMNDMRARISAALEDRSLQPLSSQQERALLLRQVNREIDRIIDDYKELEGLKRSANEMGRYDVVADLQKVEKRLRDAVTLWGQTVPLDRQVVDEYIRELSKLVKILYALDDLYENAEDASPTLRRMILNAKSSVLSQVDERALAVFGYRLYSRGEKLLLSHALEEWQKAEWVDYQVAGAFYEIIYLKLIQMGTERERERMLLRALEAGVEQYARGRFALAKLHFDHVLEHFAPYSFDLGPVYFYRSECLYAMGYYDDALAGYRRVMESEGEYAGLAAVRVITLAHLGVGSRVEEAYRVFQRWEANLDEKDRAVGHFLAGLWYLQQGQTLEAARALELVPGNSKLALRAKFLRGVALVQLKGYESAQRVFSELARLKDMPGRGHFEALLGNAATVKLGMIAYEQGDMDLALKYLDQVSQGYPNFDEALLARAWSHLKKGDYSAPIPAAETLADQYFYSEYAYEALVLKAHCKRILGQREDAMEALRYVANARAVEDLGREFARERIRLVQIGVALDSLGRAILDRGDAHLYPTFLEAREQVEFALWVLEHPGSAGARMLQQFNSERSRILRVLDRAERLREAALKLDRKDVAHKIGRLHQRLMRAFETYHSDLNIARVNHFVDYPLALRESTSRYVVGILDSLKRETALETFVLQRVRSQLDSLRWQATRMGRNDLAVEAEFQAQRLSLVAGRLSQLKGWACSRDVELIDADFNRWADFSGFGMSDITLAALRDRQRKMATYSYLMQSIEKTLRERKVTLEKNLEELNERIQQLEYEWQQEKIAEARAQKEEYFRSKYFDTSTREVPPEAPKKGETDAKDTTETKGKNGNDSQSR